MVAASSENLDAKVETMVARVVTGEHHKYRALEEVDEERPVDADFKAPTQIECGVQLHGVARQSQPKGGTLDPKGLGA